MKLDDIAGRAVISIEEAGRLLTLGRSAAYEAAHRGQIPTLRLGQRLVVPVPALLAVLGAEDKAAEVPYFSRPPLRVAE